MSSREEEKRRRREERVAVVKKEAEAAAADERTQMLKITHYMLIDLANGAEAAGSYEDTAILEKALTIVSRQLS